MKKRSILLYWLLLLVPTVIIGVVAFYLLQHEQERMNRIARSSALDRARAITESLQVTVETVEDGLQEALRDIPENSLEETLLSWEATNPLIRNVFIWNPDAGLRYPPPNYASNTEEGRFSLRYGAIFSGRIPWQGSELDKPATASSPTTPELSGQKSGKPRSEGTFMELVADVRKLKTGRRELAQLAKLKKESPGFDESTKQVSREKAGWIPWFEENRLYILGWIQKNPFSPVYGVELELMALLSRLVPHLPQSAPHGMIYTLIDGSGRIFHQSSGNPVNQDSNPDISLPLAPHLPHWRFAVHFSDKTTALQPGKGFFILSLLLLGIFITAILAGGALLTWQAYRNIQDARQKTSFVSGVSHELKTPLTSIRMYAELLHEGRVKDTEKRNRYLKVIVAESQRLTRLVNNVLDFSRLEQGRKKYRIERLELTEVLYGVINTFHLRLKEAGMTLRDTISDSAVFVRADRDAIEQVFLNLFDNAIKYASEGNELSLDLKIFEDRCEIQVSDKGPGIPKVHQKKIFEKFHRVDDSLTSTHPGSGLGLSIALRILRDINGDLRFEPGREKGSCFFVTLPLDRDMT